MSDDSFSRLEVSILEGRASSTRFRQNLFHSLHKILRSSEKTIKDAIATDTGNSESEVVLEYALALSELHTHYNSFNLEDDLKTKRALENLEGSTSVGIVYVIPSKQSVFYSVISVITAALAAGNCVILELPPTLTQISDVLRKILPSVLDADVFAISTTRLSEAFLSKCLIVAQNGEDQPQRTDQSKDQRSKPSTKVVAVVDRTADVAAAASVCAMSRISFNGQSVYAPDVVLVNEFVADDFLLHLTQPVTSPFFKRSKSTLQHVSKSQPDRHTKTMKEIEGSEGYRVVVSGASGSIIELTDRTNTNLGRRVEGRVVVVCRITSLDDAIDLCANFGTPLEASYLFAASAEANYLSRFIDARLSCINHIPAEILVGPFAPAHPSIAPTPSPRYSPAFFRTPRPRLIKTSNLTSVCQQAVQSKSTQAVESWAQSIVQSPLAAMKQAEGKAVGFFDQAIMLVGITVLSVVAGGAFYTVRMFWRR